MFYQPPFIEAFNNMVDSAPWSPQYQILHTPFMNPYQGTANPFPAQFAPFVPSSDVSFPNPLSLAVSYQPNWKPTDAMARAYIDSCDRVPLFSAVPVGPEPDFSVASLAELPAAVSSLAGSLSTSPASEKNPGAG